MHARRALAALATLLSLLFTPLTSLTPAVVHADETWCDTDPPVIITTPAGNHVVVYVFDGGPVQEAAYLLTPTVSYSVQSTANGTATGVHLTVLVQSDSLTGSYAMTSQVWSGPGGTGIKYAEGSGVSGTAVPLHFTLNTP